MSHAEHFLTRLERLAGSEVELALELYRDPGLVGTMLQTVAIPDGATRLAISLDDPTWGPFLVVTRDGAFVTCLGRGMRPGDLPVVTRPELDACGRKVSRLREKLALVEHVQGEQRKTRQLLRRLFFAPERLCREDFLEVAAWEPLIGSDFLMTYVGMGAVIAEQGPILRNARVRGARGNEALREYWNLVHTAGHLALLGSMTADRDHYAKLTETEEGARAAMSYPLTGTGVVAFILKGAWAAGRLGKLMLPEYKRAPARDVSLFELFDSLFALLALGTRTRSLRAEIQKALRAAPTTAHTPEAQRLREAFGTEIELCCTITAELLEAPQEAVDAVRLDIGQSYFVDHRPLDEDPIRRELVRTLPLMSRTDGFTDGQRLVTTLHLIAATAREGPEQFYLPRELHTELVEPWKPSDTWTLLEPTMKAERARRAPVVKEQSPGRNDKCPCGSGKKWKRCCGG